tara:strand:+ start:164 stop:502 length:339 start_codon:yes stop_codon:yes gene_type:complete
MSIENSSKQKQIMIFVEKAKKCTTDHQKIKFFDSFPEAFFIGSNKSMLSFEEDIPKDLDDAFYVYANMKKFNEKELEDLKSQKWIEYPEVFKIFLFDFCILNGDQYLKYFSN